MNVRYGTHLTPTNIRRVWAVVTQHPNANVRQMARLAGLSFNAVSGALRLLKDAGYIDFEPNARRARTIVVPFYVMELQ